MLPTPTHTELESEPVNLVEERRQQAGLRSKQEQPISRLTEQCTYGSFVLWICLSLDDRLAYECTSSVMACRHDHSFNYQVLG